MLAKFVLIEMACMPLRVVRISRTVCGGSVGSLHLSRGLYVITSPLMWKDVCIVHI